MGDRDSPINVYIGRKSRWFEEAPWPGSGQVAYLQSHLDLCKHASWRMVASTSRWVLPAQMTEQQR